MGSDESHFNVSIGSDGQSHKTVSTNHNLFEEKGEPKRYRTEVLPLTSLTPYRWAKPAHPFPVGLHRSTQLLTQNFLLFSLQHRCSVHSSFPATPPSLMIVPCDKQKQVCDHKFLTIL